MYLVVFVLGICIGVISAGGAAVMFIISITPQKELYELLKGDYNENSNGNIQRGKQYTLKAVRRKK